MRKKIMGIDPGTHFTGYGIIEPKNNGFIAIDYGVISPKKSLPLEKRYLAIFNELDYLIEQHKPDALAVETQFLKNNVQVALKLGMARGVAILAATRKDIPIFEYTPRKAKQAVTGNGSASKEQVASMIKILLNLPCCPKEDAADALAIAICHINFAKGGLCTNI